jgi:hypothetical protein
MCEGCHFRNYWPIYGLDFSDRDAPYREQLVLISYQINE